MTRSFWKIKAAGLLLLSALALPALAQEEATHYSNGKILLQQQRYDLAMAELQPLTESKTAYAPAASYFYALAAFKSNNMAQAAHMLQQLQNQYPNWGGMADADYLQANVLFEQGEYARAISRLDELKGSPLVRDAEALKTTYLRKLNDREVFEQLLQAYPTDKALAQAFADKLVTGWFQQRDRRMLETLVSRFNLDRKRYLDERILRGQPHQVALLLPFQLDQNLAQAARKNQFVTDMYAGMKLAQDSLKQQGIAVELFAYDTGADTMSVKRVLDLPEMRQMSLLIGPVYKSTAKIANRFATQHNINVVNPLSQDLEMVQDKEHVFLFESSIATQARQAAAYAYENFSPKTAAIVFESAKDDTTFAYFYRQHFKKLGGTVKVYRKIRSDQTTATAATFKNLSLQGVGHLAVFSDKMTAAVNATSLVQSKAPSLPLLTYDDWLDVSQISLRQLDNLEVYFISPKYIDQQNPTYQWFRKAYLKQYNLTPSVYAYAGFEMLYYFAKVLQQYGPQFERQVNALGNQPGILYTGFGYGAQGNRQPTVKDNQYVPILKLENLQLRVVNPVF